MDNNKFFNSSSKLKKESGQASIEFLITFGFVILIFIIFFILIHQKFIQGSEIKKDTAGQRLVNSIAESINSVFMSGIGASECITLPKKIYLDEDYLIKFYREEPTIFLYTERETWVSPLVTPYINCTLNLCSFSNNATILRVNSTIKVKISYKNDKIYIEEC